MSSKDNSLGRVTAIHVTTTKGFAVRSVESANITRTGIAGNREFFLADIDQRLYSIPKDPIFLGFWTSYDPASGTFTVGHGDQVVCAAPIEFQSPSQRFKFDDREVSGCLAPGPWDELFSRLAGRHLRLAHCTKPGGGYDVHPVTVVSTASLGALGSELNGRPMDPRRFRLNLIVDCGPTPFLEDTWNGQTLAFGEAELNMGEGIPRCLAVENRPEDADRNLQVQRRIRAVRGATPSSWGPSVLFGVYAGVERPGTVRVGDPISTC